MSRTLTCLMAAFLVACQTETPFAPARPNDARSLTPEQVQASPTGSALPACTIYWANAVNGRWDDPTKWSTGAVPGSNDSACLNASGTYTVTLATPIAVKAVKIGIGGSNATLRANDTVLDYLLPSEGIYVGPTGTLSSTAAG
ncbi:MAG: hypothetical protein U0132_08790 [Gemmatimonadaceae bacterium]